LRLCAFAPLCENHAFLDIENGDEPWILYNREAAKKMRAGFMGGTQKGCPRHPA
jgi:hypothetical protein